MPARDPIYEKFKAICLSLPDTKETMTWGSPHFRVGDKIFAGYGEEHGEHVCGFKLEPAHAAAVIADPRFWTAPYVGHKGWVSMDAASIDDWDEVRALVLESYRLIAPKRTVAKLDAEAAGAAAGVARKKAPSNEVTPKKVTARKAPPNKTPAKKTPAKKERAKKVPTGRARTGTPRSNVAAKRARRGAR